MLANQGDPFAAHDDISEKGPAHTDFIHIRMQPRTARKFITTIEGLNAQIDFNKLLRAFRKLFNCNGTVVTDPELGQVIQLQGDHRNEVAQFLVQEQLAARDKIKLHGG